MATNTRQGQIVHSWAFNPLINGIWMVIGVRNTARQLLVGRLKAAIGENSRTLGSKLIFLGIEKQPLRYQKPNKNSVILAKGYHRPGGAGFAE
jgi:hypothetical protein